MNAQRPTFWFPVKTYGWGWGMPVCWQGWVVLVAYLALLYGGIRFLPPAQGSGTLLLYLSALTAALVLIVAWKGEKPVRWRWGKK